MSELAPGLRLRSVVSTTEVIVTMGDDGVLVCGGQPMVPSSADAVSSAPQHADSASVATTVLGKRYRAPTSSLQVLCTRQGAGVLEFNGVPLEVLRPKVLPASD